LGHKPPRMKATGLFFGSFNPVHTGHMIIANYLVTQTPLAEVWLVVSPHNPLKRRKGLADQYARLNLVKLAIGNTPGLRASSVEFSMPRPSYTIDTLTLLREEHPDREFVLIMGGDNLPTLPKWKNYELILRDYAIYVYRRPGTELGPLAEHPKVHVLDGVPLMQLSATYVRDCIKGGKSIRYLVPDAVAEELEKSGLYR